MVSVTLRGLTKMFGDVEAVNQINLHVKEGEFLTLLGPSGCGKTTTLRMIAGVENPDRGDIIFGDARVNDLPPSKRNVAMVFQKFALYPSMNARANIEFNLKVKGVPKKEREKKVMDVAKLVRIENLLDRGPKELSGGEQQRVSLARALVREPNVFLLDEPLSNLDAKLRLIMRVELRRIQEKLKVTTIFVTHDQLEATAISDRIALLEHGKIRQIGLPLELYRHPANRFVATFIGSPPMNLLDCSLIEDNGELKLDLGVTTLSIPDRLQSIVREQQNRLELELGVRPEDVYISKDLKKEGIVGKVLAVEPTGSQQYVYMSVDGNDIIATTRADLDIRTGEKCKITFDKDNFHLISKRTKKVVF